LQRSIFNDREVSAMLCFAKTTLKTEAEEEEDGKYICDDFFSHITSFALHSRK
jgi:hypothetical protein